MCGRLAECLTEWSPISDRLLMARFSLRHGHLSVVVAYAPTEDSPNEVKDIFYGQLEATIASIRPHDTLLVLDDLYATTGTDRSGFESVVGRCWHAGYPLSVTPGPPYRIWHARHGRGQCLGQILHDLRSAPGMCVGIGPGLLCD